MLTKISRLSSFILKIIAILTMTLDHVGFMMEAYSLNPTLVIIFRSIGRLAVPLFAFLLVEGVTHTKSFPKYVFRLGIVATAILITQIVMQYGLKFKIGQGNVFFDLLLGALTVKALMNKNKIIKSLAIIPLIIGVIAFWCYGYEEAGGLVYAFPYFLRPLNHFFFILLVIGFYYSTPLAHMVMNNNGLDPEIYSDTPIERGAINVFSFGVVVVATTLLYLLGLILANNAFDNWIIFWDYQRYNWMMISGAFILLYSGKRGYNSNWFRYGQYLYYPLHLLIIYGIFTLILGGL